MILLHQCIFELVLFVIITDIVELVLQKIDLLVLFYLYKYLTEVEALGVFFDCCETNFGIGFFKYLFAKSYYPAYS